MPSFAKNVKVIGKNFDASSSSFSFAKGEKAEITVEFETAPYVESRPHGLNTVKCGSLVFSLPIEFEAVKHEYERNGVERKFPYCDYELLARSDWNYAFSDPSLSVEFGKSGEIPFSAKYAPVTVTAKMRKIPWGLEDGYNSVCAKVPASRLPIGEEETVTLIPYGCAKLRMTEMPLI